jgi:hypothetical protein
MFAVDLSHCPSRMRPPTESTLRQQAADALRRARKLPVGPDRNDLRQIAIGLLWLEKKRRLDKVPGTHQVVNGRLVSKGESS